MRRQTARLAALCGMRTTQPPQLAPIDPLALLYATCEDGCGTTLALSPSEGTVAPPFRCVRCRAGKPAWPKDPPYFPTLGEPRYFAYLASYFLRKGSLPWQFLWRASDWLHRGLHRGTMGEVVYVRDADGIPLPGQVEPLDLDAYLARYHPLDVHTVVTMLVEFAVRKGAGELAWQLLHSASAEHRGDERLAPIAVEWVEQRALENRLTESFGRKISLVHQLAESGNLSKLTSLVAAGVPAWKMVAAQSNNDLSERSWILFPLGLALRSPPARHLFSFFLEGVRNLSGAHPLPMSEKFARAVDALPALLYDAMWVAGSRDLTAEVAQLLEFPELDPDWGEEGILFQPSCLGHTSVVQLLLADGRADPSNEYTLRTTLRNGHEDTVAALLGDPRVDPTAGNGWLLKAALKYGYNDVVTLLKADPRMAPWAHLTLEDDEVEEFNVESDDDGSEDDDDSDGEDGGSDVSGDEGVGGGDIDEDGEGGASEADDEAGGAASSESEADD